MRRFPTPVSFMAAALLLAACAPAPSAVSEVPAPSATPVSAVTPEPSPTPTASPEPTPTPSPIPPAPPIGPDDYPLDLSPLTGLQVQDAAQLTRRPLLIKISNAPPVVRPQSGISQADVIIEHYAEGGWTRFSAVFWSNDAEFIGSVRSGRLVDLQLAQAFDALWAFSGASNGVIDTVRASPLYPYNAISPQFGFGEPYFWRVPRGDLPFEHTLFTSTVQLRRWAEERGVRAEPELSRPGWAFTEVPPSGGRAATHAQIQYWQTLAEWRYDPLTGTYLRWSDGLPHTDALTGQQLAFENLIVIAAYHEEQNLFPEKYFGEELSWYIELQDEGPATLLRDGLAYEGRWRREAPRDLISFWAADGSPLYLKPGQSFIQIISTAFGPYLRSGPETLILEP